VCVCVCVCECVGVWARLILEAHLQRTHLAVPAPHRWLAASFLSALPHFVCSAALVYPRHSVPACLCSRVALLTARPGLLQLHAGAWEPASGCHDPCTTSTSAHWLPCVAPLATTAVVDPGYSSTQTKPFLSPGL
jgi:hypothetical protein